MQSEITEPSEGQVRIQVLACGVCHGDAIVKEGGSSVRSVDKVELWIMWITEE